MTSHDEQFATVHGGQCLSKPPGLSLHADYWSSAAQLSRTTADDLCYQAYNLPVACPSCTFDASKTGHVDWRDRYTHPGFQDDQSVVQDRSGIGRQGPPCFQHAEFYNSMYPTPMQALLTAPEHMPSVTYHGQQYYCQPEGYSCKTTAK